MTTRSPLGYQVPAETARVAGAAFPKGNLYMDLNAERCRGALQHQARD